MQRSGTALPCRRIVMPSGGLMDPRDAAIRGRMRWWVASALSTAFAVGLVPSAPAAAQDALIAKHAAAHSVPESLVRRVIRIESRGNPSVVSKGNFGLMQIRLGTARAMGYRGDARGLLDADTNMTYAVRYLAGAYRAAGSDPDRAVRFYQRGYYYEAKARGFSPYQASLPGVQPLGMTRAETSRAASEKTGPSLFGALVQPASVAERPSRRRATRHDTDSPSNPLSYLSRLGSPD